MQIILYSSEYGDFVRRLIVSDRGDIVHMPWQEIHRWEPGNRITEIHKGIRGVESVNLFGKERTGFCDFTYNRDFSWSITLSTPLRIHTKTVGT